MSFVYKPYSKDLVSKFPNDLQPAPQRQVQSSVLQINQDLFLLKEQLQQLAKKGEELGLKNRPKTNVSSISSINLKQRQIVNKNQINNANKFNPLKTQTFNPRTNQNNTKPTFQFKKRIRSFKQDQSSQPTNNFVKKGTNQETIRIQLKLQLQIKQLKQTIISLRNQLSNEKNRRIKIEQQLEDEKTNGLKILEELQSLKLIFEEYKQKVALSNNKTVQQNKQIQTRSSFSKKKFDQFDEVLKVQLQQNKQLKLKLIQRNDELQKIKVDNQIDKATIQSLKNEMKLLELKNKASCNNIAQKMNIRINDKENELQTVKRTAQSLEMKYRSSIKQIQEKDQFIRTFMVGRSKQEINQNQINTILDKYIITFPENKTMNDLIKQQQQIILLQNELSQLKQKKQ